MMRIFSFLLFFSVFLLVLFDSCAVRFTSVSRDEDLLEFGKKFPFTCGIATGEDPPHGSGCLIEAERPSLVGRVVVTAAHNFRHGSPKDSMYFFLFGPKRFAGRVFRHPDYNEDTGHADLAFVLLNQKIEMHVACPKLDGRKDFKRLFNQPLILSGVGCNGNADTEFKISSDGQVRAAFLYAPEKFQDRVEKMETITIETVDGDIEETKTIQYTKPVGAQLKMYPGNSETSGMRDLAGFGAPGDSGGPVLYENRLVGVVHGGCDDFDERIVCPMSFLKGPYASYYKLLQDKVRAFVAENPSVEVPLFFVDDVTLEKYKMPQKEPSAGPLKECFATLIQNYDIFIQETLETMCEMVAS